MYSTSRSCWCGLSILVLTGVLQSQAAAQTKRYKLEELDVPTIRAQLAEYTKNEKHKASVDPAKSVANLETVDIDFNKAEPRLNMSFLAKTEPPAAVKPVSDMVADFVSQSLLSDNAEYRKLSPNLKVSLRSRSEAREFDVFQPPPGLATPADQLLSILGECPPSCYPFTAANCFNSARACYRMGLYQDALALLNHAARQDTQASYYYLKALTELRMGRCYEASASVRAMVAAEASGRNDGLRPVMENHNGPLRVRIDELAKLYTPPQ
jgi:hypothetical protein